MRHSLTDIIECAEPGDKLPSLHLAMNNVTCMKQDNYLRDLIK